MEARVLNYQMQSKPMKQLELVKKLALSFSGKGHNPPIDGPSALLQLKSDAIVLYEFLFIFCNSLCICPVILGPDHSQRRKQGLD